MVEEVKIDRPESPNNRAQLALDRCSKLVAASEKTLEESAATQERFREIETEQNKVFDQIKYCEEMDARISYKMKNFGKE